MADTTILEGNSADDDGVTFTEGGLLAALEAAMKSADEGPADAYTVAQLCEMTGANPFAIRRELAKLKAAGRLALVQVKRRRLDDRAVLVTAYRWR